MAWQWSHSQEAYQNVREQIKILDVETLATILAEWSEYGRFQNPDYEDSFGELYNKDLNTFRNLPLDVLSDVVWDRASELSLCTNGGWLAHLCPYGCGCHMSPFDTVED